MLIARMLPKVSMQTTLVDLGCARERQHSIPAVLARVASTEQPQPQARACRLQVRCKLLTFTHIYTGNVNKEHKKINYWHYSRDLNKKRRTKKSSRLPLLMYSLTHKATNPHKNTPTSTQTYTFNIHVHINMNECREHRRKVRK